MPPVPFLSLDSIVAGITAAVTALAAGNSNSRQDMS